MTATVALAPRGGSTAPARAPRCAWPAVAVSSYAVAGYALFLVAIGFALDGGPHADNHLPWVLHVHIAVSAFALLTGPTQFRRRMHATHPGLHRLLGRVYVASCVAGGLTGLVSATMTAYGFAAGLGLALLAVLWVASTVLALRFIVRGDVRRHREWMIRSFALTFAAVTLRVYLGLTSAAGLPILVGYPIAVWLSWVPNLAAAQWWIRRTARRRPEVGRSLRSGTDAPAAGRLRDRASPCPRRRTG